MSGFPWCTFDLQVSYDTPWNSEMSTILLAHWVKAYEAHSAREFDILVPENTAANCEEVLCCWCGNEAPKSKDISKGKRTAKQPVDRGVYTPNPDKDCFPPKKFQLLLVCPKWYDQQEGLILSELDLNEKSPVDIRNAIENAKITFKSLATLAADQNMPSGSSGMNTA
ncbi:uncharacterized protein MELLADRAFT_103644 [Melampsora larici-populina 98AG31]|uniref:Uncharacterized protein n=1 Tax=Melampsora larici-populina (strain 98AG31 / pathotype 3-4-7) TaxID=747676 RepID=F4RC04_MELLP|nr:uncharacterized protein MELLADRAFT_103644 [Melampsora larici-populina 98AG31]EGG10192.1 hypothetical protein MELLADRAFT_103644 [Melampsora larici-populina 98AG31]